ncbi:MAG TPA: OmpW family outer membrane protein [Flavobacterium sp.]|nr:OmpW family outer membrane protein [Flavobacterium sp.]
MKKIITFAVVILATTVNAQTENNPTERGNWVISGSTSLNFNSTTPTTKYDGKSQDGIKTSNLIITPSFGYFVIDNLAIGMDLELSSQKTEIYDDYNSVYRDAKRTIFAVIPSATYYFSTDSRVFPYIGAGAGYASAKSKVETSETENDNFFAWKVKAGISYMITNDIAVDFGLNYNQLSTKYNSTSINPEHKLIAKNFGATLGFSIFLD